jgi:hypothetical protein
MPNKNNKNSESMKPSGPILKQGHPQKSDLGWTKKDAGKK